MSAPLYLTPQAHQALNPRQPRYYQGAHARRVHHTPVTTTLATLWLLPSGEVISAQEGRTQRPQKGAMRLASGLHPQELARIWPLFISRIDGTRVPAEIVPLHIAYISSHRARHSPFTLDRKHRESIARTWRAKIREVRNSSSAAHPPVVAGGRPGCDVPPTRAGGQSALQRPQGAESASEGGLKE